MDTEGQPTNDRMMIRISLIQGIAAVLVALIGAFGGGYALSMRSVEAAEHVYRAARISPGILVAPEGMSKEQCATAMVQALTAQGVALTYTDADAGKRVEDDKIIGFWCAKRRTILYYGVAPDLEEAQRLRRLIKPVVLGIGATEAPEE